MREALESLVQKEALEFTFVHNLFLEYLTYADDIERQVSGMLVAPGAWPSQIPVQLNLVCFKPSQSIYESQN